MSCRTFFRQNKCNYNAIHDTGLTMQYVSNYNILSSTSRCYLFDPQITQNKYFSKQLTTNLLIGV